MFGLRGSWSFRRDGAREPAHGNAYRSTGSPLGTVSGTPSRPASAVRVRSAPRETPAARRSRRGQGRRPRFRGGRIAARSAGSSRMRQSSAPASAAGPPARDHSASASAGRHARPETPANRGRRRHGRRARSRHIAQRGRAEGEGVRLAPGHPHPALVARMRLEPRGLARADLRRAHGVKPVIGLERAGMAVRAAGRAVEQRHALAPPPGPAPPRPADARRRAVVGAPLHAMKAAMALEMSVKATGRPAAISG
jgi:hypothetical protein